jgi:hypothetical protein
MRSGKHGPVKILTNTAEVRPTHPSFVHPKQRELNRAALRALRHAAAHGDYAQLTALIRAQPGVRHQEQLREWAVRFGGAAYDAARGVLVKRQSLDHAARQLAARHPFWSIPHTPVGLDRAPSVNHPIDPCRCCGSPAIPGDDICFTHLPE